MADTSVRSDLIIMSASRQTGIARSRLLAALIVVATALEPYSGQQYVTFALAAAILAALVLTPNAPRISPLPVLLVLWILWLIASATWSTAPRTTGFGVANIGCEILMGIYLARSIARAELIKTVDTTLYALTLLSFAVAIAVPSVGINHEAHESGAIEGLFSQRNIFAYVATIALLTSVICLRSPDLRSKDQVLRVAAAGLAVVATRSASAYLVVICLAGLAVGLTMIRRASPKHPRGWGLVGLTIIVSLVPIILDQFDTISQTLGRSDNFTGRTPIWNAVLIEVHKRPLTGYGWDTVWRPEDPITRDIWARINFIAYHAHNGYLDVLIQVGLIGLGLFIALNIWALLRTGADALVTTDPFSLWRFLVICLLTLSNFSETRMSVYLGFALLATVSVSLIEQRQPRTEQAAYSADSHLHVDPASNPSHYRRLLADGSGGDRS